MPCILTSISLQQINRSSVYFSCLFARTSAASLRQEIVLKLAELNVFHNVAASKKTYLGILFHQFGEVVEETVLWTQEVELIVPLLLLHQLGEELPAVPSNKLRRQLYHIQIKGRD